MHGDADAAGVVHDVDVFLLQHGVDFVAAVNHPLLQTTTGDVRA